VDGRDLAMIAVRVVDARCVEAPDAGDTVTFAVRGAGCLPGTGNGDPIGRVPDHSPVAPVFHGLAQAIVQSQGAPGMLRVVATARGVRGAALDLIVLPVVQAREGLDARA
jgi:beta-galactosidase